MLWTLRRNSMSLELSHFGQLVAQLAPLWPLYFENIGKDYLRIMHPSLDFADTVQLFLKRKEKEIERSK